MVGFGSKLGRLQYRTAEEARGAARDLGLSDVHSHVVDGERIWMPGRSHTALNDALRARGRAPVAMPASSGHNGLIGDDGLGGSLDDEMADGLPDSDSEGIVEGLFGAVADSVEQADEESEAGLFDFAEKNSHNDDSKY